MKFHFLPFLLVIFLIGANADPLIVRDGPDAISDYLDLSKNDAAFVPARSAFTINSALPPNGPSSALYKIYLVFERGCFSSNPSFGNSGFQNLRCIYNNTGFEGCYRGDETEPDAFFQPGSEVYFVSKIQFSVVLNRGLRVSVGIPHTAVLARGIYCEDFNAQTAIIYDITRGWLNRNYFSLAKYYTDDVTFAANIGGFVYSGKNMVLAYFALGDPSISDTFENLNLTLETTSSSGNLAMAIYNVTIKSLQFPDGQNIYWDSQTQRVFFNEYNLIYEHRIYVDGLKVLMFYPSIQNVNITKTCEIVQTHCIGSLEQFSDFNSCLTFMNSIPLLKTFYAQSIGVNDAGCRSYHSFLIPSLNEHCWHAGPYNFALTMGAAGIYRSPCIDDTGPWNYPNQNSRSARDEDDDNGYIQPCESENCKYKRVSRQSENLFWSQIAFSQLHESLVPVIAAILDECQVTGDC